VDAVFVLIKLTASTKCLRTELTDVRLNASVNTAVDCQPAGPTKGLVARATLVRLFVGVSAHVHSQIGGSDERPGAEVALVFHTTAGPHVSVQISAAATGPVAHQTRVSVFVLVSV